MIQFDFDATVACWAQLAPPHPLRDGRILWLFNDTLVATTPAHVRSEAAFVRNTVAIESGDDPTDASMRFYWGRSATGPGAGWPLPTSLMRLLRS